MTLWDIISMLVFYGVIILIALVVVASIIRFGRQLIKWMRGED